MGGVTDAICLRVWLGVFFVVYDILVFDANMASE